MLDRELAGAAGERVAADEVERLIAGAEAARIDGPEVDVVAAMGESADDVVRICVPADIVYLRELERVGARSAPDRVITAQRRDRVLGDAPDDPVVAGRSGRTSDGRTSNHG